MELIADSIDLRCLSAMHVTVLQQALSEDLWPMLQGLDPWGVESGIIVAVSLKNGSELIGFAFASLRPTLRYAELLSIHLFTGYQNDLALEQLLDKLQNDLRKHRCRTLNFIYSSESPIFGLIEPYLKRQGWDSPALLVVNFHFHRDYFRPQWMQMKPSIVRPLELILWKDLPEAMKEELKSSFERGNFPRALSPFTAKEPIETYNSLILRKEGEIKGWVICHRININTIRYTSFYVEAPYRTLAINLLATAIHMQQRSSVLQAFASINVQEVGNSWFIFAKKRLFPYAERIDRYYVTSKLL